jgi:two-component system alkaline phosphatase synthesis response regulator PhoP
MQEHENIRLLSEAVVFHESVETPLDLLDGAYCEITNRILIVSPRPASLRTLVAELAVRCYDVLLLHHANDPLLGMVQGTIIVMDRTGETQSALPVTLAGDGSSPVLALVKHDGSSPVQGEEWVKWPGPIEQVITKIQQLAAKHPAPPAEESRTLVFKEVTLDPNRMIVTRNGAKIDLTKTEFDLLRAIIGANGKVMTRQELMNEVWGEQYFGGSNAVDVHIRSLRSKLDDDPKEPRFIATVRGAGYRLADM